MTHELRLVAEEPSRPTVVSAIMRRDQCASAGEETIFGQEEATARENEEEQDGSDRDADASIDEEWAAIVDRDEPVKPVEPEPVSTRIGSRERAERIEIPRTVGELEENALSFRRYCRFFSERVHADAAPCDACGGIVQSRLTP